MIISGVLATQIAANVGDAPYGIQIFYCSVLALPVGWWGACGGMHGEMQGKYYRYCSQGCPRMLTTTPYQAGVRGV